MMEKLLHERLREYSKTDDAECIDSIVADFGVGDGICDIFLSLADEIERYYIPRPRFEDGEPVQFGDSAKRDFGTYDATNIDKFVFYRGGTADVSGANGHFATSRNGAGFKRLTTKVYDADGVEIKVCDIVYDIAFASDSNEPLRIERIEDDGRLLCQYGVGNLGHYLSNEVTHERPVFDAEGERICKGDTVWCKSGYRGIVTSVEPDKVKADFGICDGMELGICTENPTNLAHHEWDSLEKLRDDMYAIDIPDCTLFSDRLTALIERGVK